MKSTTPVLAAALIAATVLSLRFDLDELFASDVPAPPAGPDLSQIDPPWLTGAWTEDLDAQTTESPHGHLDAEAASCPGLSAADHGEAGHVHALDPADDPHLQARHLARHEAIEIAKVSPSTAQNGHAVAELFEQRLALQSERVRVRGVVVRVSEGVMERNFVHLRDGTGAAERGDQDLTLTTTESFAVGEEVEVEGVLATDQDFGLGYRYAALLERATRIDNDEPI